MKRTRFQLEAELDLTDRRILATLATCSFATTAAVSYITHLPWSRTEKGRKDHMLLKQNTVQRLQRLKKLELVHGSVSSNNWHLAYWLSDVIRDAEEVAKEKQREVEECRKNKNTSQTL